MKNKNQNIYLGANSFIGVELFRNDKSRDKILLSNNEFINNYQPNQLVSNINIYDCTFVSRGSERDFFEINFKDKIKLINKIENLIKKNKINLICFGSTHDERNDIFGISKRFYKYMLDSISSYDNIKVNYIILCGIYGPNVKAGRHSVVANFYHEIKDKRSSSISDGHVELAHIDELFRLIDYSIFTNTSDSKYNKFKLTGINISVRNLYEIMYKINNQLEFNNQKLDYKNLELELKKWKL